MLSTDTGRSQAAGIKSGPAAAVPSEQPTAAKASARATPKKASRPNLEGLEVRAALDSGIDMALLDRSGQADSSGSSTSGRKSAAALTALKERQPGS